MENLLHQLIKEKVYSSADVLSHISTPVILDITSQNFLININNDFYFLITKDVSKITPNARVKVTSSDNYFTLSSSDFSDFNLFQYACFRDYMEIDIELPTTDPPSVFVPYKLEFLKVTPTYKL